MNRLLFATTNAGKLKELKAFVGAGVQVLSLADFAGVAEAVEDGATFEENARKKARHYAEACRVPALADDSGLCVDVLGGAPGVLSARYVPGSDADRYQALLKALDGVPADKRSAAFISVLCLAVPGGPEVVAEGRCPGDIAMKPKGSNGFGYDPIFLLPGGEKTMAELTREEKAAVSHRGRAFALLKPTLERFARGEWP